MPDPAILPVDRAIASAALGRAVLVGRAAVTVTAAAAELRLADDPRRQLTVLLVILTTTVAGLVIVSSHPRVVRHPVPIIAADTLVVATVLVVSRGGVAYFCAAIGACALAGVLTGMRALPLWAVHATGGYLTAAALLHQASTPPRLAAFVLAFPIADVLAGIGAAVATAALLGYVQLSVEVVAAAQRSAAASERARLARELHDSVAKTLRGVSFAALALPASLRRHPALAEQLAGTVSQGAVAAAREARELLDGLRLDSPDEDFADSLHRICQHWAHTCGVPIDLSIVDVDLPVDTRYELSRILHEALRNAVRHGHPDRITVALSQTRRYLRLRISDDGAGFHVPDDLATLRDQNHYGLLGMHERTSGIGGSLRVTAAPGRGTTIEVFLPAPRPADSPAVTP